MQNKRTLFKVGCGAVAASAIAAGVIFEVSQKDHMDKFGASGKLSSEDYEFMSYVSTYGKTYPTVTEYNQRQSNWAMTNREIEKCNKEQKHSRCGHNHFSAMSKEEKRKTRGYDSSTQASVPNLSDEWIIIIEPSYPTTPTSGNSSVGVNWVTKGMVTPI